MGERVGARRRDDVDAMTEEQVADGVGVFHTSASALVGSGRSLAAHNALSEHHIHRGRGRMRTAHLISYSKSRCPSLSSMWRTTCPDQIGGEAYDIQSDKRRRKDGKLEGLGVTSLLSRHVTETCRAVAGPATKYIPT